jgi:hypothetical protein
MKKHLLILSLALVSSYSFAQKLDKTYYLLGTLHDYMGRHYAKNNPINYGYILKLHKSDLGKIKRIEDVTNSKFKQDKVKKGCANCDEFYELNSFVKAKVIHSFYTFKKIKKMRDLMGFNFYTGRLKCDKLEKSSDNNKTSFIAGLFLTAGKIENDTFKITLANSLDRFNCTIKLLTDLKCKILNSEIRDGIPYVYEIEFEPTEKLKEILHIEIEKRNTLANTGYTQCGFSRVG